MTPPFLVNRRCVTAYLKLDLYSRRQLRRVLGNLAKLPVRQWLLMGAEYSPQQQGYVLEIVNGLRGVINPGDASAIELRQLFRVGQKHAEKKVQATDGGRG